MHGLSYAVSRLLKSASDRGPCALYGDFSAGNIRIKRQETYAFHESFDNRFHSLNIAPLAGFGKLWRGQEGPGTGHGAPPSVDSGLTFRGRPMRTSRSFSIVPTGYKAFLVMGFMFAVWSRFSTASSVMPKASAISVKVSPVINHHYRRKKRGSEKSFSVFGYFTTKIRSGFQKSDENFGNFGNFFIDQVSENSDTLIKG
jgi:hypothetical protein